MRKMFAVAALAGLTIATSLVASTGQADAQFRRWGPPLGIALGAGLVTGAIIANSGPVYVEGRCGWVRQYDRFGNYLGRVWACNY